MKRWISLLSCVLLLSALAGFSVSAEPVVSGECGAEGGNLTWRLEEGVLTIGGQGNMAEFSGDAPWAEHAEEITSVVMEEGVRNVSADAFNSDRGPEYRNLVSVKFPAGLQMIGDFAFLHCTALSDLQFSSGLTVIGWSAFGECDSLVNVNLPDGLQAVCQMAFAGCDQLQTVRIPSTVTDIGETPWEGCPNLQYREYDGARYLGNEANPYFALVDVTDRSAKKTYTAHPTAEIIGGSAFGLLERKMHAYLDSPSDITRFICSDSVRIICDYAFTSCESLSEIVLSENIEKIGDAIDDATVVHYPGTEEAWKKVTVSPNLYDQEPGWLDFLLFESTGFDDSNPVSYVLPDGVTVDGDRAFPAGTVVMCREIAEKESSYEDLLKQTTYTKLKYYDFRAVKDGSAVNPTEKVKVVFSVPKEYDIGRIALYVFYDREVTGPVGDYTELAVDALPFIADADSRTVTVELDRFASARDFATCALMETASRQNDSSAQKPATSEPSGSGSQPPAASAPSGTGSEPATSKAPESESESQNAGPLSPQTDDRNVAVYGLGLLLCFLAALGASLVLRKRTR